MEFMDIFDDKIKNKVLNHLIFFESKLSTEYHNCYYHHNSQKASFRIGQILREHLLFCVYSESEYMELYNKGKLKDLDKILKHVKENRLPDRVGPRNGIYSETLLDMLVMFENKHIKKACIRTLHRQRSDNNEIKGFDSVHILVENDEIILIFGQAKLGDRSYCIRGIKDDINKLNFLYTFKELMFIADKRGAVDSEIQDILSSLNDLFIDICDENYDVKKERVKEYFESNNIKIVIPCLLAYEKGDLYSEDFDSKYDAEIASIVNSVSDLRSDLDLTTDLTFMFFPVYSKSELREGMDIDEA